MAVDIVYVDWFGVQVSPQTTGSGTFGFNLPGHDVIMGAFTGTNGLPAGDVHNETELDAYWNALLAKTDQVSDEDVNVNGIADTIRFVGGAGNDGASLMASEWAYAEGRDGDDTINGGIGADTFLGGAGDDVLDGRSGDDLLGGGAGNDTLVAVSGEAGNVLIGGRGADVFLFNSAEATVSGGRGVDTLDVSYTELDGGARVELIYEGQARDIGGATLTLDSVEVVIGTSGADTLGGGLAHETLFGAGGADILVSVGDSDDLFGGIGNDTLLAGSGDGDHLSGGRGADVFAILAGGGMTRITDLEDRDRIDLSELDANGATSGDEAFVQVSHLTGEVGQLAVRYNAARDATFLYMDTDGDGRSDITVRIEGDHQGFDNFIL